MPVLPAVGMPSSARAPRGTLADDVAHHARHVGGDRGRDRLHRLLAVAVEAPDQVAGAGADFQHRMRRHRLALVREGRIGHGVFEHRHFVGADRHRRRIRQRRLDAEFARHLGDLGAADLGRIWRLAAEPDRQFDRHHVDRTGDRRRQRDLAGVGMAVVLRTPVADADRAVDDGIARLPAVQQRGGVDVGLERRAGLAHRVHRAVELAGAVVAAADHRAHAAVEIGYHDVAAWVA